ncbi:MAG: diguanylate cyclase [Thiobacillaceae bacterium]|nr:diguanylate cyclase [Thiobacillaceae bacterium]
MNQDQTPLGVDDADRPLAPVRGERFWLLLGFAVLLGLMAMQTVLSLHQIEQQRLQLKSVIEEGLTKFDLVGRMHAAGRERILLLQRMFLTADPFEREALREAFSRQAELFIQARQALLRLPLNAEERLLLDRQGALSRQFHAIHLRVLEHLDTGAEHEAERLLSEALLPTQYAVLATLSELYDLQQRNARGIWVRSDRLQHEARRLLLAVAAMVLLTGLTVAYFVFRRIRTASLARERLATYDALTGLPNRLLIQRLIGQSIARAQRQQRKFALMFVDLDRFKAVNDSLGHKAGDLLLIEVASRLRRSVRASDTVGRLAGDEFVVLLDDVHNAADVLAVAEKIRTSVQEPMTIFDRDVQVGASIGIALYPEHGRDAEELLRHADAAMYRVKGEGRNGYRLCEAQRGVD